MTYVITQNCCNDAECVAACPVNCIHPAPGEPDYPTTDMLYIDATTCIDCGACADACPVDVIRSGDALTPVDLPFVERSAAYFDQRPTPPRRQPSPRHVDPPVVLGALRVAVVGTGAAGLYATRELLKQPGVEVNIFDRVPAVGGLVRAGVAPDHPNTKRVIDHFRFTPSKARRLAMHLGVDVGVHLSHAELLEHHHAVIYCTGARTGDLLPISGADLAGSMTAVDLAAWYNGHPDSHLDSPITVPLHGPRAVVAGMGNVAIDVARVLLQPTERLVGTDIADGALAALQRSAIEDVLIVGRRGAEHAAFTYPELVGLSNTAGIDVVVDGRLSGHDARAGLLTELARRPRTSSRCVRFVFDATIESIGGVHRVESVTLRRHDGAGNAMSHEVVDASMVIHSIGLRSEPVAGVPFSATSRTFPNDGGRVLAHGEPLVGVYVAGWAKRGPVGVIGTNKHCARETVDQVIDDFRAGLLDRLTGGREELSELLQRRSPASIDATGWSLIDQAERARGADAGRTRVKFTTSAALHEAAAQRPRRHLVRMGRRS